MTDLPPPFFERMQRLLGAEFEPFLASYAQPPAAGLRTNGLKIAPDDFRSISPFPLNPIPWCPSGFVLEPDGISPPGKHPYHAAGLYYLQDPSAMATVELLDPQPGDWVLDLAAAPGGKSTHIASLMQHNGILFANETHPQRVWELAENLERWGVKNAVILNETPERLAASLEGCFDKVLLDAPCSGEGMFRKSQTAIREWSPQRVESCALRQAGILERAARLLAPGGVLAYSTCTFAPQENESVIAGFLDSHPDFEIAKRPNPPGVAPGRPDWIADSLQAKLSPPLLESLSQAWRIWPHLAPGEGHFSILLRRAGSKPKARDHPKQRHHDLAKGPARFFKEFCDHNLSQPLPEQRLVQTGSYLYSITPDLPELEGLKIIHPGLWLGTFKKERFEPAHAFALTLKPEHVKTFISLETSEAVQYLQGYTLVKKGIDGWCLLAVDGYPLGWGKRSQGVIKNFYPKGLRWL